MKKDKYTVLEIGDIFRSIPADIRVEDGHVILDRERVNYIKKDENNFKELHVHFTHEPFNPRYAHVLKVRNGILTSITPFVDLAYEKELISYPMYINHRYRSERLAASRGNKIYPYISLYGLNRKSDDYLKRYLNKTVDTNDLKKIYSFSTNNILDLDTIRREIGYTFAYDLVQSHFENIYDLHIRISTGFQPFARAKTITCQYDIVNKKFVNFTEDHEEWEDCFMYEIHNGDILSNGFYICKYKDDCSYNELKERMESILYRKHRNSERILHRRLADINQELTKPVVLQMVEDEKEKKCMTKDKYTIFNLGDIHHDDIPKDIMVQDGDIWIESRKIKHIIKDFNGKQLIFVRFTYEPLNPRYVHILDVEDDKLISITPYVDTLMQRNLINHTTYKNYRQNMEFVESIRENFMYPYLGFIDTNRKSDDLLKEYLNRVVDLNDLQPGYSFSTNNVDNIDMVRKELGYTFAYDLVQNQSDYIYTMHIRISLGFQPFAKGKTITCQYDIKNKEFINLSTNHDDWENCLMHEKYKGVILSNGFPIDNFKGDCDNFDDPE